MTSTVSASHTIDAGGIDTSYLVRPAPATRSSCCTARAPVSPALANWQRNIPTLSQRFHVLAPDIVGFGATERPDDVVYSLRTWTDHTVGVP